MKRIYTAFVFLMVSLPLFSQKGLSEKDRMIIDHKIDSIIDLYLQYSTFQKESDFTSLSQEYIDGFQDLFVSPSAEVVNDLDAEKKTPKLIPVSRYIDYVKEWYPYGLMVSLKDPVKSDQGYSDIFHKYQYRVEVDKELSGHYKESFLWRYSGKQFFTIEFDNGLQSFKIRAIQEEHGNDSCQISKKMADDLFAKNSFRLARDSYEKMMYYCPGNPDATAGYKRADSAIDANRKPVLLTLHALPGISTIKAKNSGEDLPSTTGFTYAIGVGAEVGVWRKKNMLLSVGLAIDLANYNSTFTKEKIAGTSYDYTDADGDNCDLLYTLTSFKETDKITYLQVPVFAQFQYSFSKLLSVYVKAGATMGLSLSSKYITTGNGDYKGYYEDYGGIILYGNELFQAYGYGDTAINVTGSGNVNLLNISAFGGVGVTVHLGDRLEVYIGAEYIQGFSDIANTTIDVEKGIDKTYLTKGYDDFNSIFGSSEVKTNFLGLEAGLRFKIFKY